MKPSEYLDKCKIALNIQSDYALAKALEMNSGMITHYYKGKRWPDAYACARIALALKLDPFEVLADIEEQSAKNESRAAFWRGFIGRTKKAAACLLLALSFGIFSMPGTGTKAGVAAVAASAALVILLNRRLRIMYIMLNVTYHKIHQDKNWHAHPHDPSVNMCAAQLVCGAASCFNPAIPSWDSRVHLHLQT